MPIKDKSHYPADWNAIALRVKQKANWTCAHCGRFCRMPNETNEAFRYRLASKRLEKHYYEAGEKPGRFILNVAHLLTPASENDHSLSNLIALCSVCHLALDRPMHQANARITRAAKKKAAIAPVKKIVTKKPTARKAKPK